VSDIIFSDLKAEGSDPNPDQSLLKNLDINGIAMIAASSQQNFQSKFH
jgi:hypothetical protein